MIISFSCSLYRFAQYSSNFSVWLSNIPGTSALSLDGRASPGTSVPPWLHNTGMEWLIQGITALTGICCVIGRFWPDTVGSPHGGGPPAGWGRPEPITLGQPWCPYFLRAGSSDFSGVVILTSARHLGISRRWSRNSMIRSGKATATGRSSQICLVTAFGGPISGGIWTPHRCYPGQPDSRWRNTKIAYDSIMPSTLLQNLPDLLIILIMLIMSASMSTSLLVLTSSSTLTIDFYQ